VADERDTVATKAPWEPFGHLGAILREVGRLDHADVIDYERRNQLVLMAIGAAAAEGVPVGIRLDPSEPEWPVVYFELPTGQASWHLPQHVLAYDGHTTEEKYRRLAAALWPATADLGWL